MTKYNAPLLTFNRGLLAADSLARVDLDRTKLSAEVMTNWIPSTQGSMRIRPGTKYVGSSLNDSGAEFIEFYAATDQTALLELTNNKMRVWVNDTGNAWETPVDRALMGSTLVPTGLDVPLARPLVDTTVTLSDTGWSDQSTGGAPTAVTSADLIPKMTAATTSGVTITASSENAAQGFAAWKAADDTNNSLFNDTGAGGSTLPTWWNVDFGAGNTQRVRKYSIRAGHLSSNLDNAPNAWRLITGNFDTGTFATDTGKWTLEDERTAQTGWAVSEKREYTLPGSDTGTVEARRHWRLYVTTVNGDTELKIAEVEMFDISSGIQQVAFAGGTLTLNAGAIGALAKTQKRVVLSDTGTEHSLAVHVSRGPVTLRVGSTAGDDDYIEETNLGTGYHNLAFTPQVDFHITLQSKEQVDRIVQSLTIGDSGTVEVTTPWGTDDLDNIRYDQSADVVYVDCSGVRPYKIERRGDGRSWSVVEYVPQKGPFLPTATSTAKLDISERYGNTTLSSDIPFFTSGHVGALFRVFTPGQSGKWILGAKDAHTDPIEVTGINDTGEFGFNERQITFVTSGTWIGTVQIQRSFDGPDEGFRPIKGDTGFITGRGASDTGMTDTGTATFTILDKDDNLSVWYRAKLISYTSGAPTVTATYRTGGVDGICRVTGYQNNKAVDVEVISRFSDTGQSDSWQEGAWSTKRGYPTAVALYEGRLAHAGKASLYISVADDYENFDDSVEGESGPIIRTFGSGPVNNIFYLIAQQRLIAGTSGHEIAIRSSSLDEPLTPDNNSAKAFSTQGSANLRAVPIDSRAIFVQRSKKKLFSVGFGSSLELVGDYETSDLTLLTPDALLDGVTSITVQRQPDTRIHCALIDGTVAILTFEPQEEVLAWYRWKTDTGTAGFVERVMTLPGVEEDRVYYHVRRTINGATKRFLERWAMESESRGDTGLSWLSDCAWRYTSATTATDIQGGDHLIGRKVVGWSNDTGQTTAGKDLSPDVNGVQTTYTVDTGGNIALTMAQHHVVAGLPYKSDFKSSKLAYAADFGTALTQWKRVDKIAFVLSQTHNNGLFFGSDTGNLDPLPRMTDEGAVVDDDRIFTSFDQTAMPFPGLWDEDSRVCLRAKSPRPVTVLAAVPTVTTNEKV